VHSGICDDGNDALADGAFRRPHAAGFLAEKLLVEFHCPAHVNANIFGQAVEVFWQLDVRHGPARLALVPQQRQDGMVERRGGQFDLAAFKQLAMQRNHLGQQSQLLVEQPLLLFLRPAPSLLAKSG